MQRLWKQGLGWDEPVPPAEECAWRSWLQGLEEIATLRIPRWVAGRDEHWALHIASSQALSRAVVVNSNMSRGKGLVRGYSHEWQSTLIDSIHLLLLSSFHSSVSACDGLLEKLRLFQWGWQTVRLWGPGCRVSFFSFVWLLLLLLLLFSFHTNSQSYG